MDDSPLALVLLRRMLSTSPLIEVVGTARNGREALAAFERARPDVICTDYQMPEMDGLELIRHTMASFPRPILVISSVINPAEREQVFPLLAAGAVDVFAKPDAGGAFEQSAAALVQKIKLLSGVVVISRRVAQTSTGVSHLSAPASAPLSAHIKAETTNLRPSLAPQTFEAAHLASRSIPTEVRAEINCPPAILRPYQAHPIRLVAIGSSTGGPQTLQTIFGLLPLLKCPVLCVQHISSGFLQGLVEWLDGSCRSHVKIAENGEIAVPGTIYFPPEHAHIEIDDRNRLKYSHLPPVGGHKPAVTVAFESVARSFGHNALGVLLTGMGSDGAPGMEKIMLAGGATIAQNEASCVVFGMPKQAIARGAAHFVLSPEQIAEKIARLAGS